LDSTVRFGCLLVNNQNDSKCLYVKFNRSSFPELVCCDS